MNTHKLHMSLRSPFARRIRVLLEELSVPYEVSTLDVFNPPAWYTQVNPMVRVPALELPNGEVISDSNLIQTYFRETHSHHEIFNTRGFSKAQTLQWSAVALGIMEMTVMRFLETLKPEGTRDLETILEAERNIQNGLKYMSAALASTKGAYLAGDSFGVWDIDLGTAVGYAILRLPAAQLESYPDLKNYYESLLKRESFKKTVPPS